MSSLLVEVVEIKEVRPHDNADRLEIVEVKGWTCIVQKGQFQPGDTAVFVPIDAVIPEELCERFNLEYLKKGERVRTVKLRGVVSQGLLLSNVWGFRLGENVAEKLGITKWEPPPPPVYMAGGRKSTSKEINPYFFKYVDIENIKNYPSVFEVGEEVVITEKLHGTSFRAGWVPRTRPLAIIQRIIKTVAPNLVPSHEFIVGSRNVQLITAENKHKIYYDENVYEKIAKRYRLAERIPYGYILFGEIVGPGIQDLTYGLQDIDVFFYDAMQGGRYLDYADFRSLCQSLDLPMVPELYIGPYHPELLAEHTDGKTTLPTAPKQIREGVVIKSVKEEIHPKVGRKILKSVSTDYLLRKGGTEFH